MTDGDAVDESKADLQSIDEGIDLLSSMGYGVGLLNFQLVQLRNQPAKISPFQEADQERAALVMAKTLEKVSTLEAENAKLVKENELLRDTYEDVLKGRDKAKKQVREISKRSSDWIGRATRAEVEVASLKLLIEDEAEKHKRQIDARVLEWQDKLASETRRRESAEQALRRHETMVEAMSASEVLRAENARVVDQLAYTVSRLAQSIPVIT